MLVAYNKMDLPQAKERWPEIEKELGRRGYETLAISALARTNLRPMLYRAVQLLREAPQPEPGAEAMPVYRFEDDPQAFTISREDDGSFRVSGKRIERAAAMTYWEYDEAVMRFARILEAAGIKAALEEAGAKEGDTVHIGEYELEWAG